MKDIGRLAQVMEREGALLSVLLTAQPPTRAMERNAASVGVWENALTGRKHALLQILTRSRASGRISRGSMPAW